MVEFGTLSPDGTYTHIRSLDQSAMQKCPHFIMAHEHYREDSSCRCNDPEHKEMKEWGYRWNKKAQIWK